MLTGLGRYVDDVARPAMLHAAIVRSPHAHATIRGVEVASPSSVAGFVRCLTSADLGAPRLIPVRIGPHESFAPHLQPPLAASVARYVGEPVAVVLATSAAAAEDAAEAVRVEY